MEELAAVDSGVGKAGDYSALAGQDAKGQGMEGIGERDSALEAVQDMGRWYVGTWPG